MITFFLEHPEHHTLRSADTYSASDLQEIPMSYHENLSMLPDPDDTALLQMDGRQLQSPFPLDGTESFWCYQPEADIEHLLSTSPTRIRDDFPIDLEPGTPLLANDGGDHSLVRSSISHEKQMGDKHNVRVGDLSIDPVPHENANMGWEEIIRKGKSSFNFLFVSLRTFFLQNMTPKQQQIAIRRVM